MISQHSARHRHEEFVRFLDRIERTVAAGTAIHAILDNYSAHKHKAVRAWLEKHPRWTFHFTPTSCSWLNAVEGFFAELTRRRLKRGVFRSVGELRDAIQRFIDEHNRTEAKPFVWIADPDDIIAARNRGFQTSDSIRQFRAYVYSVSYLSCSTASANKGPGQLSQQMQYRLLNALLASCATRHPIG